MTAAGATLLTLAGHALLALAVVGGVLCLLAGAFARRHRPDSPGAGTAPATAITLLKPLCGEEPGLAANLASFVDQDHAGPLQVVFGVADARDPALAVVAALQATRPAAHIDIVVDGRRRGRNAKVANLIAMMDVARHGLIVVADADMRVPPDHLRRIAALAARHPGDVVTSLYFGQARTGAWSMLAAMGISYHFLPAVILGHALGMARPCMGSTVALDRATLDAAGGFDALADVLADDWALGEAVRRQGGTCLLAPGIIAHGCADASLGDLVTHELRWSMTIRAIEPLGHLGSVVTHPVPLALLGLALTGPVAPAFGVLGLAVLARAWLKLRIDLVTGASSGPFWAMPLRDMLGFAVFLAAWGMRTVEWRGRRFVLKRDGTLRADPPTRPAVPLREVEPPGVEIGRTEP